MSLPEGSPCVLCRASQLRNADHALRGNRLAGGGRCGGFRLWLFRFGCGGRRGCCVFRSDSRLALAAVLECAPLTIALVNRLEVVGSPDKVNGRGIVGAPVGVVAIADS